MKKDLRILIADDHASVRYGLKAILESQSGWKIVAEAKDGQEALDLALETRPDVVLLDLNMPFIGGAELARRLRKFLPATELLVISAYNEEEIVREAVDAGVRGYVLKTDSPRVIIAAVEAASEKQKYFSQSVAMYFNHSTEVEISKLSVRKLLTPREREVVCLLARGCTNKDVAQKLGISVKTADVHRTNIMRRLGLHSIAELVRYAVRERMVID